MAKRSLHSAPAPPRGTPPASHDQTAARRIDDACAAVVAGRLAERELAAWSRGGALSESELRLLWLLCADEAPTVSGRSSDQSGYADRLAVSAAQISGLVERLGRRQLIEAAIDPDDRRRRLWRLTAAGRGTIADVVALVAGEAAGREAA